MDVDVGKTMASRSGSMILKNHGTMAKTDEVEGLADSVS
jgi:hypothetical protein